jgi:hypothetical protein
MRLSIIGFCLLLATPTAGLAQQAVSAELIRLHDDLHLSPDQDPAWRTYTTAIAPTAAMQQRHRSSGDLLPLVPTPRRIALIEANLGYDQADFRRQSAAVLAFYNQLTADQQRTFDRETLPPTQGAPRTACEPAE